MASFTENIPQFNPYIKQLPVEEYRQAEMYKQGKYDQGVQAVQSYLDTTTGLDVDPKYKTYLQQSVNGLQDQIKKVVGADFSDMQLVNQIGGAASKIIGDKTIQAGIQSSAVRKSIFDQAKKADNEGKGSTQNTWDIEDAYQKWASNPDLSKPFNYSYTPYRDVKKKILDVIKQKIGNPNENISDDAFDVDKNGNVVGVKDVMLRKKLEQVNPDELKAAIYTSLDPSDFKQLEIDGRYSYAGASDEQMAKAVSNSIEQQTGVLKNKRNEAEALYKATKNNVYKDQMGQIDKQIDNITKTYSSYTPDQAKAQLYADNTLNQFGNAFSYTKLSQTYEVNPAKAIEIERMKIATQNDHWQKDYDLSVAKMNQDQYQFEHPHKTRADGSLDDGTSYGGVTTTIPQNEIPEANLQNFTDKINEGKATIDNLTSSYMRMNNLTPEDLSKQEELYNQNDKSLLPTAKAFFESKAFLQKKQDDDNHLLNILKTEADQRFKNLKDLIPKDAPYKIFTNAQGKKYTISPEDIVNFNQKYNTLLRKHSNVNLYNPYDPSLKTDEEGLLKDARSVLSDKEFQIFKAKRAAYAGNTSQGNAELDRFSNELNDKVNSQNAKLIRDKTDWINQQLALRTGESERTYYNIDASDKAAKYAIDRVINDLKTKAGQKGEFADEGTSIEKVNKALLDPNSTYSIGIKDKTPLGEANYTLKISSPKEGDQTINISPLQKQQIFGNADEGDDVLRSISHKMLNTGNNTTNYNFGKSDNEVFAGANYTRRSFPNVQHYAVRADVIEQNGGYALQFYVTDPKDDHHTIKTIQYSNNSNGLMTGKAVSAALTSGAINDVTIFNLLYHRDPTPEELKEINSK